MQMVWLKQLSSSLLHYQPDANISLLEKAYYFSQQAHQLQLRATGEPFFLHPVEVAKILIDKKADLFTIVAALLHDTVEDSSVSLEQIEKNFGSEVRFLVDGVTKLQDHEVLVEENRKQENLQKLLLATSLDIRVLLIKLADRLHNMRTLHFLNDKQRQIRIARETIDVYVPIAEKMHFFHNELEDLAFQALAFEDRNSIKNKLQTLETNPFFDQVLNFLKKIAANGRVVSRIKTPFSIWEKMKQEGVLFEKITDIFGYRIVVESQPECYLALAALSLEFPDHSITDHILKPKENHYQALHFVIQTPRLISIQIQTDEMERTAENGSAAHWIYKFELSNKIKLSDSVRKKILQSINLRSIK